MKNGRVEPNLAFRKSLSAGWSPPFFSANPAGVFRFAAGLAAGIYPIWARPYVEARSKKKRKTKVGESFQSIKAVSSK